MASLPQGGEDEVFAPPARPFAPLAGQGRALGVVALGGVLGASARYGVGLLLPHAPGTFPLGTLLINVVGGFLIGVLIDAVAARPLLRPFAITGILGGFTTFSTYAVDAEQLLAAGRLALAGAYLVGTLGGALVATWLGLTAGPAGAPVIPLLVIVGAAVGAPLRYATDRIVQSRHDTGFPWGTFTVNVVGSFVLGVVVAGAPPAVVALVGTGFCGALTTYSTFGYETVQLATGSKLFAVFNALGSVLAGLGAAGLGLAIGSA